MSDWTKLDPNDPKTLPALDGRYLTISMYDPKRNQHCADFAAGRFLGSWERAKWDDTHWQPLPQPPSEEGE